MAVKALYEKVAELVKLQISDGEFKQGEKIDSEKVIGERYQVSRITVRKAIDKLCTEGLLVKRQGVGTYVNLFEPIEAIVPAIQGSFSAHCIRLHSKPNTKVISKKMLIPNSEISEFLGLQKDEPAIFIQRLRLIDDVPAIVEEDFFHPDFHLLIQANLNDKSLFDVINNVYNIFPEHYEDKFFIIQAPNRTADLLNIEPKTALLCVDQKVFKDKFKPLFFNRQLINTEHYHYSVYSVVQKQ